MCDECCQYHALQLITRLQRLEGKLLSPVPKAPYLQGWRSDDDPSSRTFGFLCF